MNASLTVSRSDPNHSPPRATLGRSPHDARPEIDLVVAGGGITGMVSAALAHRQGLRVLVLESEPELGGNARLGRAPDGSLFPRGSTVLCTLTAEQRGFLQELGVPLDPAFRVHPDRVFARGGWLELGGETRSGRGAVLQRQIETFIGFCEREVNDERGVLPTRAADLCDAALRWDDVSFHDLARTLPRDARATLSAILRSDAAQSTRHLSALAGMVDLVICHRSTSYLLPGGNHAIVRALERRLSDGARPVEFRCDSRLSAVREAPRGLTVTYRDARNGSHEVSTRHLLLALPGEAVDSIDGIVVGREQESVLRGMSRGSYHLLTFFLDHCPLDSHAFHLSPDTRWVTDVVQVNALGDRGLPAGSDVPSMLTAYLPRLPRQKHARLSQAQLVEAARRDVVRLFPDNGRLAAALEVAPCDVSTFPRAMAAPAPGQVRKLRDVPLRLGRSVHRAHSDLAFFSALGAIEIARLVMRGVSDCLRDADARLP